MPVRPELDFARGWRPALQEQNRLRVMPHALTCPGRIPSDPGRAVGQFGSSRARSPAQSLGPARRRRFLRRRGRFVGVTTMTTLLFSGVAMASGSSAALGTHRLHGSPGRELHRHRTRAGGPRTNVPAREVPPPPSRGGNAPTVPPSFLADIPARMRQPAQGGARSGERLRMLDG